MKSPIVQQTKHMLRHDINEKNTFWITRNCMEPLNDEIKLQADEKNKNWKVLKRLRTNNIVNFNTIR